MSENSLLVIGCGDLGSGVAAHCVDRGWRVWGLRRQVQALPAGVAALAADVTAPASLAVLDGIAPSHVLLALSPSGFSDDHYRAVYVDGLRHCLARLDRSNLRRLLWVSSTGVYHQDHGALVDENSPAQPAGFSGRRLLEAENLLRAAALPHTSVRFGGIYGPGRGRLLRQLRDGYRTRATPVRYSNRIHRDDAVGILQFLLEQDVLAAHGARPPLQDLYVGVDTEPAPIAAVEAWFAAYLGLDYAGLREQDSDARGGDRRCSSARLQALGYRFLYPSYREGLPTLLD